jgi:Peptidase MA superfamily
LEVARTGLQRVQSLIAAEPAGQIDIYAYPSTSELQVTLTLAGLNWVAGHADPDLGVMVVALPDRPEKRLLMEQRIPHELMHILLYEAVGPTYTSLPTWVNEGLASIAELYPNPDYQILLEDAYEKDALLTISSLCQPFPRDAYSANLAYAEAASFTRYLQQQYGSSGLSALVQGYADGLDCDRGVEMSLGHSLLQLERDWRQAVFFENPNQAAMSSLMPWLTLLVLILLAPLGLAISRLRSQPVRQLVDEDKSGR